MVTEAARSNNRSVNAEITSRLDWSFQAHPSAPILRAMIDLHEKLLAGKTELVVPRGLQTDIRKLADERGVSPQNFLVTLLMEAMTQIDEQTDLGRELEAKIMQWAGTEAIDK